MEERSTRLRHLPAFPGRPLACSFLQLTRQAKRKHLSNTCSGLTAYYQAGSRFHELSVISRQSILSMEETRT